MTDRAEMDWNVCGENEKKKHANGHVEIRRINKCYNVIIQNHKKSGEKKEREKEKSDKWYSVGRVNRIEYYIISTNFFFLLLLLFIYFMLFKLLFCSRIEKLYGKNGNSSWIYWSIHQRNQSHHMHTPTHIHQIRFSQWNLTA